MEKKKNGFYEGMNEDFDFPGRKYLMPITQYYIL